MTENSARRRRLQITLSVPMLYALEALAERNGMALATQASVTLRQALDRTISTDAVQKRLAEHRAYRTAAEWRAETQDEWQIDKAASEAQSPESARQS